MKLRLQTEGRSNEKNGLYASGDARREFAGPGFTAAPVVHPYIVY